MQTKIITLVHAYGQCVYIVLAKYQIAPLKAVVGVDWPIKTPPIHIQKPYQGKIVKVLTAVILSKIIFCEPNSIMHMFNVYIV